MTVNSCFVFSGKNSQTENKILDKRMKSLVQNQALVFSLYTGVTHVKLNISETLNMHLLVGVHYKADTGCQFHSK